MRRFVVVFLLSGVLFAGVIGRLYGFAGALDIGIALAAGALYGLVAGMLGAITMIAIWLEGDNWT